MHVNPGRWKSAGINVAQSDIKEGWGVQGRYRRRFRKSGKAGASRRGGGRGMAVDMRSFPRSAQRLRPHDIPGQPNFTNTYRNIL